MKVPKRPKELYEKEKLLQVEIALAPEEFEELFVEFNNRKFTKSELNYFNAVSHNVNALGELIDEAINPSKTRDKKL